MSTQPQPGVPRPTSADSTLFDDPAAGAMDLQAEAAPDPADLSRILVAIDYTHCARAAIEYGLRLARSTGSSLHVIHVDSSVDGFVFPPACYEPDAVSQWLKVDDILHERHKTYVHRLDEEGAATEEHEPSISRRILRYAHAHDLGMIVMGTRGRGVLSHLVTPSIAENVAWHTDTPVITIRPDVRFGYRPITRILVSTDFSASTIPTLRLAARLARLHAAEVHLVHAYLALPAHGLEGETPFLATQVRTATENRLRELPAGAGIGDVDVTVHLKNGSPVDVIMRTAKRLEVDLIVIDSHRPAAVWRLFTGSVLQQLIRKADCPVLSAPIQFGSGHE
jgi:nucleotide-binding universal stress UspA family protein